MSLDGQGEAGVVASATVDDVSAPVVGVWLGGPGHLAADDVPAGDDQAQPLTGVQQQASSGPTMGGRPPLLLTILGRILPSSSPADGARPLVLAATDPNAAQGSYYGPKSSLVGRPVVVSLPRAATDRQTAARLWSLAEQLTSVSTPASS